MSLNLKFVKKKFIQLLEKKISNNEILAIWNHWVLKDILSISRVESFLINDFILNEYQFQSLNKLIKHLLSNQPVEYFFGYTQFLDYKIYVNKHVLIPRPETEELVELVLRHLTFDKKNNIIDIGTGSGCIAVALKKRANKSQVFAVDVCDKALSQAKFNATFHRANIQFKLLNILNHKHVFSGPMIDVLVSNPPYVMNSQVSINSTIHAEPSSAIFVPKNNPLIFYKSILDFAKLYLNKNGLIFLEINPDFVSELTELILAYGYSKFNFVKDLYQKSRFIIVYS